MVIRKFAPLLPLLLGLLVASVPQAAWAGPISGLDANLVLWLDATDLSSFTFHGATNNVMQWNDKSGNGNDVSQSSATRAPERVNNGILGMPAVWFDETRYERLVRTPIADDPELKPAEISIFAVYRPTVITDFNAVLSLPADGPAWHTYELLDHMSVVRTSTTLKRLSVPGSTDPQVGGLSYDGTTMVYQWLAGPLADVQSVSLTGDIYYDGSTRGNQLAVGAWANNDNPGSEHFDGYIGEILVFNRGLTPAEFTQVQTYLAQRFNIIPEPSALVLVGLGIGALGVLRLGRRRKPSL